MTEYRLITGRACDVQKQVNEHIGEGWSLYGSPCASPFQYTDMANQFRTTIHSMFVCQGLVKQIQDVVAEMPNDRQIRKDGFFPNCQESMGH